VGTTDLSVDRVDEVTAGLRQGDVILGGRSIWLAEPRLPLSPVSANVFAAAHRGVTTGPRVVVAEHDEMVLVTQTCDLVRSCADRPNVQVAPLVRLSEEESRLAGRGRRPRYVPVRGAGPDAFVDTDLMFTVEKSILVGMRFSRGCRDPEEERALRQGLARKFARPAFPDDLVETLRPLRDRVLSKAGRASQEGRLLDAIVEIRVSCPPTTGGEEVEVFLSFCPATTKSASAVASDGEWDQQVRAWVDRCRPSGRIGAVDGMMIPLSDLTALAYLQSESLDLDYLTS